MQMRHFVSRFAPHRILFPQPSRMESVKERQAPHGSLLGRHHSHSLFLVSPISTICLIVIGLLLSHLKWVIDCDTCSREIQSSRCPQGSRNNKAVIAQGMSIFLSLSLFFFYFCTAPIYCMRLLFHDEHLSKHSSPDGLRTIERQTKTIFRLII